MSNLIRYGTAKRMQKLANNIVRDEENEERDESMTNQLKKAGKKKIVDFSEKNKKRES